MRVSPKGGEAVVNLFIDLTTTYITIVIPFVEAVLMVVKSLINNFFTMILLHSPRQGGSNGGLIIKIDKKE